MAVELVTQAEYARRRGVAREAVRKAVAEGRVSLIEGRIDPTVADVQWSTNTRARADAGKATTDTGKVVAGAAAGKLSKGEEGEGYWGARSRREEAEASLAELELAAKAGSLIDRAGVEMAMETAFRLVRDAIMATPDRLPLPTDVCATLRNALRDTLADVEKTIQTTLVQEPVQ